MKHLVTAVLLFNLGAASLYAEQKPVKLKFSGSSIPTSINLGPDTITDEELLAGNGTLGPFTFRKLRTDGPLQPSSTCSGPNQVNVPVVAGGGVFRFQDGSLLTVVITEGSLCVDFVAQVAHLTETHQITGGTGRFEGAKGNLMLTGTLRLVLSGPSGPALLTSTGELAGTVSGVATGDQEQNGPK